MTRIGRPVGARRVSAPALFFFGTLMDPEVLALVLGRRPDRLHREVASIAGHVRRRVAGERFPMLAARRGGRVEGLLVDGLVAADIERLCAFEGRGYVLRRRRVATAAGRRFAWVFLADPRGPLRFRDSGQRWDFARWRQRDKPRLLAAAGALIATGDGVR